MVEVIYFIFSMLCMVLIGEWTYHWTVKEPRKLIFAGLLYAFALLSKFVLFPKLFGIFYILELVVWFMICEGKWTRKLLNIIMLYFLIGFVDSFIDIFMDTMINNIFMDRIMDFLRLGVVVVMFYIICRTRWYHKIIKYMNSVSVGEGLLIMLVLTFSTAIAVLGDMLHEEFNDVRGIMIFRVTIAIAFGAIFGLIVWLVIESYQKKFYVEKNALKDEVIHAQHAYYEMLCEKDREMRGFRHDMVSQIGLLQMLLERDNVAEAKEYLNRIHQEFEQASFHKIHVGEERLDAILSMMNQRALEKGILLEISGELEQRIELDIYELCTIFSNAINNAMEACDRLEDDKNIAIKLLNHTQTLCCRFENTATEEMYQNILSKETSKVNKNEHGYGVRNIRNAVERLKGSMEYQYQDGKVILEIFI